MPKQTVGFSTEVLQAALEGLEVQLARIEEHIAQVRSLLGGGPKRAATSGQSESPRTQPGRKRRRLSPEGRKRIAEAARRRWAALRKSKEGQTAGAASKKSARKQTKKAAATSA